MGKSLPEGGAGEGFSGGGEGEEAAELARPERAAPEAGVVKGDGEDADEDEEDVLARGGAVRARARHVGGEVDGVDVSCGAEDEEEGVGAVEKAEAVPNGSDDPFGEGVAGAAVERGRMVVVRGGAGTNGFHV